MADAQPADLPPLPESPPLPQLHVPPARPPALTGIKPPRALVTDTRSIADSWRHFKQSWRYYSTLTRTQDHPQDYQVALFLHTLGEEAQKIYNGLQFPTAENNRTVEQIITAFDAFAVGELNETYERFVFNNRAQQENETFDQFLSTLRTLIKTCNFCANCVNSILRDRIVLGIRDATTQTALLKVRQLTLDAAIHTCRAAENATL